VLDKPKPSIMIMSMLQCNEPFYLDPVIRNYGHSLGAATEQQEANTP